MNKRSRISLALDYTGLVALAGAALSLTGTFWFAASLAEGLMLETFSFCLTATVAAFLAARMWEISQVFMTAQPDHDTAPAQALPDNVEAMPERRSLPRAA